ncbi:type I toxin-antitoxin system SymE family toxin [Pseudoxanthomonas japonensis]|nr:type I toxin-antitoxin system SymE family toxin [Pseudoxanthomonas japonensis]
MMSPQKKNTRTRKVAVSVSNAPESAAKRRVGRSKPSEPARAPIIAEVNTASETPTPRPRFRIPRRCTVGYQYYDERRGEQVVGRAVPMLRLSGRWLEQCGFAVGDELQVTVGEGVLVFSRRKEDGGAV